MKVIELDRSLETYYDELVYTEAGLSAQDLTKSLAALFQSAIEKLLEKITMERAARRDVLRANAMVKIADFELDNVTMRFGQALLVETNRNRESLMFRRFFPNTPSELIRTSLRDQAQLTLSTIIPELDKLEAASMLKPYKELMQSAAEKVMTVLTTREQATATRALVGHDVLEWKEGCNALRLSVYAELLKIAAEKGYSKSWANSFFKVDARSSEAEKEDEAEEQKEVPTA